MNLKLSPLSRSRTEHDESGDEPATGSNRRYLWATIGLAGAVFLGRRWLSGDSGTTTAAEQRPAGRSSDDGMLSRRMKAMVVGTAILALVRLVRRWRTNTSER